MVINLSTLRKLETPSPGVLSHQPEGDDRIVVLVKLREGYERPSYLVPRGQFADGIFSAEVQACALQRIETDPAVESVSISKSFPATG